MKLSIIIPAYNEEGNIGSLTRKVRQSLGVEHELIVVDDGSIDNTLEELDLKICRILQHNINKGKGYALKTGIEASTGDIIGFIDGDAQDDPRELLVLIQEIEKGADLVIGSRFASDTKVVAGGRRVKPRYSKNAVLPVNEMGNRILTKLVNWIFGGRFTDVNASLRLYRADKLKRMRIESKRYEVEIEMAIRSIRMNFKIVEVPIHRYPRHYGKSNLYEIPFGRVKYGLRVFKTIIKGYLFWR